MTCWFVAALITECFRARGLRRASKLLRLSPRQFPRSSSHLEAPKALGAASWRLQGLWEQLSRGSKGLGSSYLEAPEALGAAISTLQRLWEQPSRGSRGSGSSHLEAPEALEAQVAPTSVFSSFLEYSRAWRPLGESPNGSWRLEEAFRRLRAGSRGLPGGFEWP